MGSTRVPILITSKGAVLNASSPRSLYNSSNRSSPVAWSRSVGTSPSFPPSPVMIGSGTEKRETEVEKALNDVGRTTARSVGNTRTALSENIFAKKCESWRSKRTSSARTFDPLPQLSPLPELDPDNDISEA